MHALWGLAVGRHCAQQLGAPGTGSSLHLWHGARLQDTSFWVNQLMQKLVFDFGCSRKFHGICGFVFLLELVGRTHVEPLLLCLVSIMAEQI